MIGSDRDSAWAFLALVIAVIAALVAAPWDADIRGVAIDGTVPGATTQEGAPVATGNETLAGGTTDPGSSSTSGSTGASGSTGSGTTGSTGSTGSGDSTGSTGSSGSGGSSGSTGSSGSSGSSGGTTSPGGGTPGTTPGGGTVPPPAGTGGTGANGKGVSDTQVRIGFTDLIGQQDAAGQLGFSAAFPDPGDTKAQIQAVVDWANANGGIAGRELVPIIKEIRMLESSDEGENDLCNSMVEDEGQDVFAAVHIGTIREAIRQCLAEGGVISLDSSGYPMTSYLYDETVIDGVPYLWSPSYPTLNDVGDVLADSLDTMGFFEPGIRPNDPCVVAPCNVGIILYDFPNYNRLLDEVYLPSFERIGEPIISIQRVDSRDAGSIESGLTQAVIGFQRDQVSRVLFMGGPPLAVFFQINAANSGYRPAYGVSTFDQPRFTTDNTEPAPDQAWGMSGVGFAPTLDVHDDKYERDLPMENLCLQIFADVGITFDERSTARTGMAYCQSVMMLKHVADASGPDLTARSWTAQAATLGTSFQTVDGFRTKFTSQRRAGSVAFRRFKVNPDCYCTEYVSDTLSFPKA